MHSKINVISKGEKNQRLIICIRKSIKARSLVKTSQRIVKLTEVTSHTNCYAKYHKELSNVSINRSRNQNYTEYKI